MGKSQFLKPVIFVTAVIYLVFVLVTLVFSGSWHSLIPEEGLDWGWISGHSLWEGIKHLCF